MKTGAARPSARRGIRLCVLALCAAGLAPAADAHHSYAVFDASKTITVKGVAEPVFTGWMVAASPALSALDDPRYDVWLLRCKSS